jgi:hypothetical protein
MQAFYVYIYFRPDTGTPCYVGKGRGKRWLKSRSNAHLCNLIAKFGTAPCVKIRSGLSEAEAFTTEIALIKAIGRGKNGPLFNLTDGGDGASGAKRTAATRAKMSAAMAGQQNKLGHIATPKTRAKLSAALRGKTKSLAHRDALSAARRGRKFGPFTFAHRAKISAALKGKQNCLGRVLSQETKTKMSVAALKRRRAPGGTFLCLG